MQFQVDIINACCDGDLNNELPSDKEIHRWVDAALNTRVSEGELCVRIVDEAEITSLNTTYRNKAAPTNVLSFAAQLPKEVPLSLLGDVVICAPVVAREAIEQGKSKQAHWAHMLVHGALHLLGYDHQNDQDADLMETLESKILRQLDFPDPYLLKH